MKVLEKDKQWTTTIVANKILSTTTFNKKTLADELGISRPTLDKRLFRESEWKVLEIKWLDMLHKQKCDY